MLLQFLVIQLYHEDFYVFLHHTYFLFNIHEALWLILVIFLLLLNLIQLNDQCVIWTWLMLV